MGDFIWLIVIATSIWVLIDAKTISVSKGKIDGLGNMGPWGWFFSCLFIWILAFPFYIAKRPVFKKASDFSGTIKSGKSLIEVIAYVMIGLCLFGFVLGVTSAFKDNKNETKEKADYKNISLDSQEENLKSSPIGRVEIVDGKCQASSHTAMGEIGEDLTKRKFQFLCNNAIITFFSDASDHIMITFLDKKSQNGNSLAFAGRVEQDGIIMNIDKAYFKPGKATEISEGWCKFFFKGQNMSSIVCGAKVDENGYRTTAIITFDAALKN